MSSIGASSVAYLIMSLAFCANTSYTPPMSSALLALGVRAFALPIFLISLAMSGPFSTLDAVASFAVLMGQ